MQRPNGAATPQMTL